MYWAFILLIGLSASAAFQVNVNPYGFFGKRFQLAAIFGDSTSDTGNVFQLTNDTWPISPPNYKGRYSNSYNWADDLKVLLKYNYAYGSATTDNNFVAGYAKAGTVLVPGLRQQVQQYLSNPLVPLSIGNTAHIVWGGSNDAIFNQSLLGAPQLIVGSLMNSVTDLLAGGAKTIIVFNQVPFQSVPANAALNRPALFSQITTAVNTVTNASLRAIQANNLGADIYLFDYHSLITNLLANPPSPVTNTTGYCWNVIGTTVQVYCTNPNEYFFADTFHTTRPVQEQVAKAVDKFFLPGFVPSAANYFYATK